MILKKK